MRLWKLGGVSAWELEWGGGGDSRDWRHIEALNDVVENAGAVE